jgi:protein required for attachment to host cells
MGTTWILCADRSRARLFEIDLHSDAPREVADFANPAGRAHERDLRSDADGRYYGKGERNQGHAAIPDRSVGDRETERFAESLRDYLERARAQQRFGQLWVAAAPAMLGLLRQNFGKPLRDVVEFEIDKEFTTDTPRDIQRQLVSAREARMRKSAGAQA